MIERRAEQMLDRHTHQEFILVLNTVERAVPAGKLVHAVLDNYATHKAPPVKGWLARHAINLHFTPTSGLWSNQVERRVQMVDMRQIVAPTEKAERGVSPTRP